MGMQTLYFTGVEIMKGSLSYQVKKENPSSFHDHRSNWEISTFKGAYKAFASVYIYEVSMRNTHLLLTNQITSFVTGSKREFPISPSRFVDWTKQIILLWGLHYSCRQWVVKGARQNFIKSQRPLNPIRHARINLSNSVSMDTALCYSTPTIP